MTVGAGGDAVVAVLAGKFAAVFPILDERQRRLWAGAEAIALGHGGIGLVARACGLSAKTVGEAAALLREGPVGPGPVRRPGAGRKPAVDKDPGLVPALLALVEPAERGDPMSPLRWTTESTRDLAATLTAAGHPVSASKVGQLLRENGFSLQGNAKVLEGVQHPDRDAQFRYINDQAVGHQGAGEPVVSVDAKKKEVIGQFKNPGRTWRPKGDPVRVNDHDFPDAELGKAAPYGVYDITGNTGWVNVGTDHDTAGFAVESIRRWWNAQGRADYPNATRLLITADAGGSNGYRTRAWKTGLAALADETGLQITVCHFPPGTSKWNKVEHRLFSHITMAWRGMPLTSHEVVVQAIAATTTGTGLRVTAELDPGPYPIGVEVEDAEMDTVPLVGHGFHGEWNYTVCPRTAVPPQDTAVFTGRATLTHPVLTGMPESELDTLLAAVGELHRADSEAADTARRADPTRRRAPGGGRRPKLTPADQVAAALAHQRLNLPPGLLARILGVSKPTILGALSTGGKLLDRLGFTPLPSIAHLTTLAGLALYATAPGPTPTTEVKSVL
jgi:hypothetical protein